ncbi:MAG: response regulator transcription factor, partial [Gammaproteobacteria bacterium]
SDEHVEVHLKELFELAYKKERFKEVIVAIVDFAMPNLNGLQFAERLKNKKINVIMLTGEAENSTAIKALNEGLIVKFIKKDAKEIIFTLKRWIFESQMNFFKASSMPILQAFSSKDNNLIQLLSDQSLINYFHELVEKYKIEEYYLMNPTGSFSLIDIQGNIRWFIVKTADQLKKFAESHANLLTKTEVDQLKSGDLMPLLLADQIPEDFDKKYSKYFVKPVCLSGKEIYYVASGTEIMDAPKTDRQICTLDSYIDSLEE